VGASIRCKYKGKGGCSKQYHYKCAQEAGCIFLSNIAIFCPAHRASVEGKPQVPAGRLLRGLVSQPTAFYKKLLQTWTGNPSVELAAQLERGDLNKAETVIAKAEIANSRLMYRSGALSVMHLGHIEWRRKGFHTEEHLFPVGYEAERVHWSYMQENTRVKYMLKVLDPRDTPCNLDARPTHAPGRLAEVAMDLTVDTAIPAALVSAATSTDAANASTVPTAITTISTTTATTAATTTTTTTTTVRAGWDLSRPVFEITATDDPSHPIRDQSCSAAWVTLIQRSQDTKWYDNRRKNPAGDTYSFGLSGPYFMGLGQAAVQELMEHMPNVRRCARYNVKFVTELADEDEDEQDEEEDIGMEERELPVNESGTARTEGYDVYRERDRRAIIVQQDRIFADQKNRQATKYMNLEENRGRNSKYSTGTETDVRELPVATQYYMMKRDPGRARVGASKIHDWGLFCGAPLLKKDSMVIEYLGELVRQKVADVREKRYEASGEGSCYMFRIDDEQIVDSTKRGNISRFINHCCDPNCYTRVVKVDGWKKIVVFANRDIYLNDEITYDYFFAAEDESIRCNCGAPTCAGRLN
jgi:hypothetical protein